MPLQGQHLGMALQVADLDQENVGYFRHCAAHAFHLQSCTACNLLRYPPTTTCPFCGHADARWVAVEGRGAVHSYTEVHHAIQPGFKPHAPYLVLLVDLDRQNGEPTEHDALRVVGNLVTADGKLALPELVAKVGIGTRVRMVFADLGDGLSLPQWAIDETAAQPKPWRYPIE